MREFLLEILCEEIPARMQLKAQQDLKDLTRAYLADNRLEFDEVKTFVTPRRLVLFVPGLPPRQPDVTEEKKGPKIDAPKPAIDGFLKSVNLTLEECERKETDKGVFLYTTQFKEGRPTAEILTEFVPYLIKEFNWPKSMTWGSYDMRWVRPINHVMALFDNRPLDIELEDDHITCDTTTKGHRFMAHDRFTVVNFTDYQLKLRDNFVVIDPEERQNIILTKAKALCEEEGLVLKEDKGLLQEVAGLVEWPVVLMGKIDDRFMDLPAEVLTTSMRSHQKYFSVSFPDGSIAPYFVMVSHMESPDGGTQIVAGNERVLRARLADAQFFWETDRKKGLDAWNKDLEAYIFHERLGSTLDKVHRLEKLVGIINPAAQAIRAAALCKADLVTEMVGEFPELQGVMGYYYAKAMGESEDTALAIKEHYAPAGPSDQVPTNPVSVTLALADKIDNLVGFWSVGIQPTGSKDPYALRRSALGIIRLILENDLPINLLDIFGQAYDLIPASSHKKDYETVLKGLQNFMVDRLKNFFKGTFDAQHVQAVLSSGWRGSIQQAKIILQEFSNLMDTETGQNLITGYKRAANIVAQAEKKGEVYEGVVQESLLQKDEEKALYYALTAAHHEIHSLMKSASPDYKSIMTVLANLRPAIDRFFDNIMVQDDNPEIRTNRLNLMAMIKNQLHAVADFSAL